MHSLIIRGTMKSLYFVLFLCFIQSCLGKAMAPEPSEYEEIDINAANVIDTRDICSLPHEGGQCRALFYRYGFDVSENRCKKFVYGGCNGNANNFRTLAECQQACPGLASP